MACSGLKRAVFVIQAEKDSLEGWIIAKSDCGELQFTFLDLGIQEFRFGPQFRPETYLDEGFQIMIPKRT